MTAAFRVREPGARQRCAFVAALVLTAIRLLPSLIYYYTCSCEIAVKDALFLLLGFLPGVSSPLTVCEVARTVARLSARSNGSLLGDLGSTDASSYRARTAAPFIHPGLHVLRQRTFMFTLLFFFK